jgi:hypothetical protein
METKIGDAVFRYSWYISMELKDDRRDIKANPKSASTFH